MKGRQALCECFEYLSPINTVFGSTLLETERSSITTSAERPMRAAILRAPPGAGKASSHATTRADPCRDLPAPGVDNLSLTLITSRDQSEQKPETRTQIPFRFRGSHLKKKSEGVHLFIGRNELIRTKREIYSHRRNQTHGRSHGKSRRVSQKTDPRKNRARRRNRPTPGVSAMGKRHGKPPQKPYPGNRGLVSALFTKGQVQQLGLEC